MKKLLILAAIAPWCSFAQSEMALAKVPKCEAWKLSKVEVRPDVDKAWTHSVDDDYVVRLLTIAAQFGSMTACENLAKLGRDRRWSKARIERWLYFAEACRDTIEAGHAPKMELKSISDWPISWIGN